MSILNGKTHEKNDNFYYDLMGLMIKWDFMGIHLW